MRMTWTEFKNTVEKNGIQPDDIIGYIDFYGNDFRLSLQVQRYPDPDNPGGFRFSVR